MEELMEFFPFEKIRPEQNECIELISQAVKNGKGIIIHAPTGLGKTAAALVPALHYAKKNKKTVFFLTSRNTQHHIAIETANLIREKSKEHICAVDMIGRQWMCAIEHAERFYSSEFADFCKKLKEHHNCEHYNKIKKKDNSMTLNSTAITEKLLKKGPMHSDKFIEICEDLCPYEMATIIASKSDLIIADYFYIFHPHISKNFLNKIKKEPENCIIIVDEAHNLPERIRETLTRRISSNTMKNAIVEAKKHNEPEEIEKLVLLQDILNDLGRNLKLKAERLVSREELIKAINRNFDYDLFVSDLEFTGEAIKEKQPMSFIARIADFLSEWLSEEEGFTRIISMGDLNGRPNIMLSYRCLDPSVASRQIIEASHSTILMSGTLTPTDMYRDILGLPEGSIEKCAKSPFPEENRLSLIIPKTTTKFSERSEAQFAEIARICKEISCEIPGNVAIFFPSYNIRDIIARKLGNMKKPLLMEETRAKKSDRKKLLEKFKSYKDKGAVLLGVSSGSFGEGIDLPGELLKGVIVVGMPFKTPDLETKELISYYDKKFGKGWEYGYTLPAMSKVMQNAGRCIRSETDKGAIIFLDMRYSNPNYRRAFPSEWNTRISKDYIKELKEFFS